MSPGGIGSISNVFSSQVEDYPAINSPEFSPLLLDGQPNRLHIFYEPKNFKKSEVSRNWQTCFLLELSVFLLEPFADISTTVIAPNDSIE